MSENGISFPQLLLLCQEAVGATASNPYYNRCYRSEEVFYWPYIPYWIVRDLKARQARVLDIGCAYGTLSVFAKLVSGGEAYCTDFRSDYLSPALIERYGLNFRQNNIELDPFPWELRFDAILLTEVLEHFNFQPVPTLRKLRSLLAPHGRVYLSTPDAAEWGKTGRYRSYRDMPPADPAAPLLDDHVYVYDWEELQQVIAEAGLQVLDEERAPGVGRRHFNLVLAAA